MSGEFSRCELSVLGRRYRYHGDGYAQPKITVMERQKTRGEGGTRGFSWQTFIKADTVARVDEAWRILLFLQDKEDEIRRLEIEADGGCY